MDISIKRSKYARFAFSILLVILGNFGYAIATVLFVEPSGLIMGGVTGIGLFANHIAGVSVSAVVLIVNVMMLILGLIFLGRGFAAKTIASTFVFPLALEVCEKAFSGVKITDDLLLCAVFGGIIIGASLGIVFKADASTGGMDVPPLILNKYFRLPVAFGMWGFDVIILLTQSFTVSMEAILYGILLLIIYTVVLDKVLIFGTSRIEVKVISKKWEEIKHEIMDELDRGVTCLHGRSGFMEKETEMVVCVISSKELPKMESLIKNIDPSAFVIVNKTTEVFGRGFTEEKRYEE